MLISMLCMMMAKRFGKVKDYNEWIKPNKDRDIFFNDRKERKSESADFEHSG